MADTEPEPLTRARAISIIANGSPPAVCAISSAATGSSSGNLSISRRREAPASSGRSSIEVSGAARHHARGDLLMGGSRLAVGQHQDDPLVDRAAREVVQEAQGRLVGVLEVVHHEQQPGSRGCHAHQLGGGDEQPLVAVLPGPAQVASGQRALDLGAVVVSQAVEQRRVSRHSALSASSTGA